MISIQRWTNVFKALGNENRLQILRLLDKKGELPVNEISKEIRNGVKNTSKHLILLAHLNMLDSKGKQGSVWYKLSSDLYPEIKYIISHFLRE